MAENLNLNPDQNSQAEETFDTTALLLDILSHWKWVVLSVVVFLVGAYFYIASVVPVYQVTASLNLNNEDNQTNLGAFSIDGNNPLMQFAQDLDQSELEIMKSRNNLINVVDSLGMAYSYSTVGTLRNNPIYENIAILAKMDSVSLANLSDPIVIVVKNGTKKNTYDIEAQTWLEEVEQEVAYDDVTLPHTCELLQGNVVISKSELVPELEGEERIVIQSPIKVTKNLSAGLAITFDKEAKTIARISYDTDKPQQGIDIINTMIDFYNRQIVYEKNMSARQTEAFILERLVMINDELRDVEKRLQEYRQEHNISDMNMQLQADLMTKGETETERAELEAEQQLLAEIEAIVRQSDIYATVPAVTKDKSLSEILESYNDRVSRLNRMLDGATPDNPTVKQLQDVIIRDKERILKSIASARSGLNARRNNIAAIEGRSASKLSNVPTVDKGLQEIFREQQVKVNIYTFLLEKREEIALQKTLATPTARLIDNPIVSDFPISPRKMIIFFLAFILGLAVPSAIIFIRRMFFPVFKDQEELQRLTKVPVIGEISVNNAKGELPIVVGENVSTSIAELFRLLRNNIGFTKNGAEKKVILLTSSISGEGKTFIATNLAMTYALTGKRTVVIGLDIRRPVLAHRFGLTNQKGATTFLSGHITDLSEIIHQSKENENLFIIPAGPIPPNPNELLLSENMSKMIAQLRKEFDYIILDTAPIGLVSDSLLIIPHSDIQLYVQRASYSTKSGLRVLHTAIAHNQLPDPYIVLNGVNIAAGSYNYRKYGHYATGTKSTYGYGYGYASRDDDKKKK